MDVYRKARGLQKLERALEAIAILAWLLEETQTFVRRRSVKRTGGSFGATSGLSQCGQYTGSGATVLTTEDPGSDFRLREETAAAPQQMSESPESSGNVPNQLAILVPSFDPSRDDLQVYSQKV